MNLLEKLSDIHKSVDYMQKTATGNQGAMYVDTPVLIKKIRDKMSELKVLLIPSLSNSTVESIPAPTKNNKDAMGFLFKSNMTYTWMDAESNDKLEVPWFITAKHMSDPAMAGGSALTYFERYFMLKFFQIPTSKDDPEFFEAKTGEKISEQQLIQLREIIESKGYVSGPVLAKYSVKIANVGAIENLPVSKFEAAKTFFSEMDKKDDTA